jgi:VCBS repeat-containing protein
MATSSATTNGPLNGGVGDDLITGNELANTISGGSGNDTVLGGGGDDRLMGDAGNDVLDGGAGNDTVSGGSGDDVLVYVVAENAGSEDTYSGDAGIDTLRLVLTRSEWMSPEFQSDLAHYLDFLAAKVNPTGQAGPGTFDFTAFKLHAGSFEKLEVTVDGVALDPRDQPVTAVADAATVSEDGTVAGAVLANDVVPDLIRSVELIAAPAHGALTFNPDGTYVYTPGAYFNSLAVGETATETFQYRVTDADFDTGIAVVTVTITGSNDAPVVTNTSAALIGTVQEDARVTASGQLAASDVDHGATQTWTVLGTPTGVYGSIAVDATGQWTYTLANAAHQDLAAGESHDEAFTIRVTDDHGAFVDQAVKVTVVGTNDAPVITNAAAARAGAVQEDQQLTAVGQLSAADVDHGATQTWSVQGTPTGAYGSIAVDATGKWTYRLANAADQALAAGESHDDAFTIRVTDDQGAFVDQTVAVTVTGSNDAPVIQTGDVSRGLDSAAVSGGLLLATGDGQFTDSDLRDTHVVSAALAAARLSDGALLPAGLAAALPGALSVALVDAATGDGQGEYRWNFALDTALTQQMVAAGESLTVTYDVQVSDDHGASAMQQVTITFPGSNDAPVVSPAPATGAVTELRTPVGALTDSGTIAFTDSNSGDTHSVGTVTASAGALGTLSATVSTDTTGSGSGGVITWNYSVAAGAVEYLAAGKTKTEHFTFNVQDDHGGSVAKTVDVTITGTDDAPVVAAAGTVVTAEDTARAVSAISISDVDAGSDPLLVSLAVGHGALTLANSAGLTLVDGDGSDGTLAFSGSLAAINAALAGGVAYLPSANFNGSDQLAITANDQAPGGALVATGNLAITVTPVNDAPVLATPDGATITATPVLENTAAGFQVADLNATDVDGDPIAYYFKSATGTHVQTDGNFRIDPVTGVVTTARVFDYETVGPVLGFTAYAGDGVAEDSATYAVPIVDQPSTALDSKIVISGWTGDGSGLLTGVDATSYAITSVNGSGVSLLNAVTGLFQFNFSGWSSFQFVVSDGVHVSAPATVTLVTDPDPSNAETFVGTTGNDVFWLNSLATVDAGAGNDTVTVTFGASVINGGAGSDTIRVIAGAGNTIDGGAGADNITLETASYAGPDTVIMHSGEAAGDVISNFQPGTDVLRFQGFGAGATLSLISSDTWQVADASHAELFRLVGVSALGAGDSVFV